MQNYFLWPGAFSFTQELQLLLEYVKEQIDLLLFRIMETNNKLNGL